MIVVALAGILLQKGRDMNATLSVAAESTTLSCEGSVATLTLRHGAMNAIDDALLDELSSSFKPSRLIPAYRCSAFGAGVGFFPPGPTSSGCGTIGKGLRRRRDESDRKPLS